MPEGHASVEIPVLLEGQTIEFCENGFIDYFFEVQLLVGAWAGRKGWWGLNSPLEAHALFVSEIAESMEALRVGGPASRWASKTGTGRDLDANEWYPESFKPEGVPSEMADCIIRMMHYAAEHGINLGAEIIAKMKYNETTEFRHGGKTH